MSSKSIQNIVNTIKLKGPISRNQITELTNLRLGTVIGLVNQLIQDGVVVESGIKESTGGRRSQLLSISSQLGLGIGIEIRINVIRGILSDLSGNIKYSIENKIEDLKHKPIIEQISSLIEKILYNAKEKEYKVIGIGIANYGFTDFISGVSLYSPHQTGLENISVKEILEKEFKIPVQMDDIARTIGIVEKRFGIAKDKKNFIFFFLDDGIGSAIFANGDFIRGSRGVTGEIGHLIVNENGPQCGCGNHGCLETVASGVAIVQRAKRALENGVSSFLKEDDISIETIIEAAKKGDKLAFNIITQAGEFIGKGIASTLNILGSELIIIGGKLKEAGDILIEPIKRVVKSQTIHPIYEKVEIKVSSLNKEAGALGASILALNKFLNHEGKK